jgi:hypothetical protein
MRHCVPLIAFVVALGASLTAAATPFWGAQAPRPFETPFGELQPGEFTWAPEIAPSGPILVVVGLDEQRAFVYRNGVLIGRSTVSTGKKGHKTPTGVFHTTLKDADHHSSIYNNAPMPFTQRFTADGVALHAGGLPGYPESHGCVHLPSAFAKMLFDASPLGMTIVVAESDASPANVAAPTFLAPVMPDGKVANAPRLADGETFRWEPEKAPDGPLSIILSRADARVVVLRNGVEIGRTRIGIVEPERPLGTHVLVAKVGADGTQAWTGVGVVGHFDEQDTPPDPEAMARIRIPREFYERVTPLLSPGTTVLVTDAPILERTTGVQMSVLTSAPGP